jgi:hypothetical protein
LLHQFGFVESVFFSISKCNSFIWIVAIVREKTEKSFIPITENSLALLQPSSYVCLLVVQKPKCHAGWITI